jgi:hypothetical protein
MVWNLLFAHFLGDFLFQTDWMVRNRDNLWVLGLHGSIHFVLMVLLVGSYRTVLWPYLLLVAMMHFTQDRIKNNLTNRRPDLIPKAFIVDQVLHYITIWAVVWWSQVAVGSIPLPAKPLWALFGMTYLIITYVWFISERVLNFGDRDYIRNINSTKYSRMLIRAGLLSLFLLVRNLAAASLALVLPNPYPRSKFRGRAVLTDLSVSLLAAVFLAWVLI